MFINYSEETKCENCISDKIACGVGVTQIAIRPNGDCEKIDECKNCVACAVSSNIEACAWYNLFKESIGDKNNDRV